MEKLWPTLNPFLELVNLEMLLEKAARSLADPETREKDIEWGKSNQDTPFL